MLTALLGYHLTTIPSTYLKNQDIPLWYKLINPSLKINTIGIAIYACYPLGHYLTRKKNWSNLNKTLRFWWNLLSTCTIGAFLLFISFFIALAFWIDLVD